MILGRHAALATTILAASWLDVISLHMRSLVMYSSSDCAGTPIRVDLNVDEQCITGQGQCTMVEVGGVVGYYLSTCIGQDPHAYMANIFAGFAYVAADIFKESRCQNLEFIEGFLATGTCSVGDNSSVIARQDESGGVTIKTFDGTSCGGDDVIWINATSADVANHTCLDESYVVYSSAIAASNSGGSSSGGSKETVLSEGTSNSSSLSIGAIVGITIGSLVLVLVAATVIVWWCLSKRKRPTLVQCPSEHVRHSVDHDKDEITAGYSMVSETDRETMAHVHIPAMPLRATSMLLEDELIVAVRIPRRKVLFQELISRDGFAEVYKGTFNNQLISVKRLSLERQQDPASVEDFCAEVKMMAEMDHPRIVQFIGVAWQSRSDLCAVSEYLDGGDLRTLLDQLAESRHPEGFDYDKVKIALHVAHALTYLHSLTPPVMHRNLRSANIVLSSDWDAKLTDFGVSGRQLDCTMNAGVGSAFWTAPEVVSGHRYSDKADVYSFGVVLSELDVHLLPYSLAQARDSSLSKMSDTIMLQQVAAGKLQVDFSSGGSGSVRELGLACVLVDPTQRPTSAELLYKLHTVLNREMKN